MYFKTEIHSLTPISPYAVLTRILLNPLKAGPFLGGDHLSWQKRRFWTVFVKNYHF